MPAALLGLLLVGGVICLTVAVDYDGPPGERVCSYDNRRTHCSDSNESGATVSALFTGAAADTEVSQPLLWVARVSLGTVALVLVGGLVVSAGSGVVRRRRLQAATAHQRELRHRREEAFRARRDHDRTS